MKLHPIDSAMLKRAIWDLTRMALVIAILIFAIKLV
jgi:hypothetical protein